MPTELRIDIYSASEVGPDWCVTSDATWLRVTAVPGHLGGCFSGASPATAPGDGAGAAPAGYRLCIGDSEVVRKNDGAWWTPLPAPRLGEFYTRTLRFTLSGKRGLVATRKLLVVARCRHLAQIWAINLALPASIWLVWLVLQLPEGAWTDRFKALSFVTGSGVGVWLVKLRDEVWSPKCPSWLWLGVAPAALITVLLAHAFTFVVANGTPAKIEFTSDGTRIAVEPGGERIVLHFGSPWATGGDMLEVLKLGENGECAWGPETSTRRSAPTCETANAVNGSLLARSLGRLSLGCWRLHSFTKRKLDQACEPEEKQVEAAKIDDVAKSDCKDGAEPQAAVGDVAISPHLLASKSPCSRLARLTLSNSAEALSFESKSPLGRATFGLPRTIDSGAHEQLLAFATRDDAHGPLYFKVSRGTSGASDTPLGELRCKLQGTAKARVRIWVLPMGGGELQRLSVSRGDAQLSDWTVLSNSQRAPALICLDDASLSAPAAKPFQLDLELGPGTGPSHDSLLSLPAQLAPIERVRFAVGGAWQGTLHITGLSGAVTLRSLLLANIEPGLTSVSVSEPVRVPVANPEPVNGKGSSRTWECEPEGKNAGGSIWRAQRFTPGDWGWVARPAEERLPASPGSRPKELCIHANAGKNQYGAYAALAPELALKRANGKTCRISRKHNTKLGSGDHQCRPPNRQNIDDVEWSIEHQSEWVERGCDPQLLEVCDGA